LRKKEGEYIREFDCIKRRIAGRTREEYYDENRVKILENKNDYYESHKEENQEYNKDEILLLFLNQFQNNLNLYKKEGASYFWNLYHENLFKKNTPMAFENADKVKFMGIIKQVMPNGLLQIELEEDTLRLFDIKELKMLY
jgi:biotin-(acetyl-CoA carboxylase) ligase